MNLDKKDHQLLRVLGRNARISNVELAQAINLSPTPCLRRLRRLEQGGVIDGYRADINADALGFKVTVFAFIKLSKNTLANARSFEAALGDIDEVREYFVVSGAQDYLLRILCRDLEAYEALIKERLAALPLVSDIESVIVLKQQRTQYGLPEGK